MEVLHNSFGGFGGAAHGNFIPYDNFCPSCSRSFSNATGEEDAAVPAKEKIVGPRGMLIASGILLAAIFIVPKLIKL